MTPIPHIIHQTWKTASIPYEVYDRRWVESWPRHHPDWLCVLWTDRRLRELGRACYPELAPLLRPEVPGIFLADVGRYMVLHHFGGLYVDLDYECFRSLTPLLAGHPFVTSYSDDAANELNNALIASVPRHPLLRRLLDGCLGRWTLATSDQAGRLSDLIPEPITGPEMMTEVAAEYLAQGGEAIQVYAASLLCPIGWRRNLSIELGTLTPETIARTPVDYPEAYAATYWTHVR